MKPKSRDVALDLVHVVFSDALVLRLALLLELPRTLKYTHCGDKYQELCNKHMVVTSIMRRAMSMSMLMVM